MVSTRSSTRAQAAAWNNHALAFVMETLPLSLRVRLGQSNRLLHSAATAFTVKEHEIVLHYGAGPPDVVELDGKAIRAYTKDGGQGRLFEVWNLSSLEELDESLLR